RENPTSEFGQSRRTDHDLTASAKGNQTYVLNARAIPSVPIRPICRKPILAEANALVTALRQDDPFRRQTAGFSARSSSGNSVGNVGYRSATMSARVAQAQAAASSAGSPSPDCQMPRTAISK